MEDRFLRSKDKLEELDVIVAILIIMEDRFLQKTIFKVYCCWNEVAILIIMEDRFLLVTVAQMPFINYRRNPYYNGR